MYGLVNAVMQLYLSTIEIEIYVLLQQKVRGKATSVGISTVRLPTHGYFRPTLQPYVGLRPLCEAIPLL